MASCGCDALRSLGLADSARRQTLSARQSAVLRTLRAVLLLSLALLVLRPSWVSSRQERHQGTVVFLLDRSRSMTVRDGPGGKSRHELMTELLESARPALAELSGEVQLKVYGFGSRIGATSDGQRGDRCIRAPDGDKLAAGLGVGRDSPSGSRSTNSCCGRPFRRSAAGPAATG